MVPADLLLSAVPTCQSKLLHGAPCCLCGMTTAFILISHGQFGAALGANRFSLCLYSLFVVNELAVLVFLARRMRARRLTRKRRLFATEETIPAT